MRQVCLAHLAVNTDTSTLTLDSALRGRLILHLCKFQLRPPPRAERGLTRNSITLEEPSRVCLTRAAPSTEKPETPRGPTLTLPHYNHYSIDFHTLKTHTNVHALNTKR